VLIERCIAGEADFAPVHPMPAICDCAKGSTMRLRGSGWSLRRAGRARSGHSRCTC